MLFCCKVSIALLKSSLRVLVSVLSEAITLYSIARSTVEILERRFYLKGEVSTLRKWKEVLGRKEASGK